MSYFYADLKGFFQTSSPVKLNSTDLIQVPSLPPDRDYKWSVEQEAWVKAEPIEKLLQMGTNPQEIAVATVLNRDFTTEPLLPSQQRQIGVIKLDNLNSLDVGNNINSREDLDLFYYKNSVPKQTEVGIYTQSKGYIAFPNLSWDKSLTTKTINFIFYCNGTGSLVFGLAGDRYNWNSNDYNKLDLGVFIRGNRGLYGYCGLSQKNQNTFTIANYSNLDNNSYYRLSITKSGEGGELLEIYQLPSSQPKNWLLGELVTRDRLPFSPSRSGKILTPGIWNYTGKNNKILGAILT